jgi:hypothetical protein
LRDTALVTRSRRTSAVLVLPVLLGAFRPPKSNSKICCDTIWMVTGTSFHEDRGGPGSVVEKLRAARGR